MPASRLQSSIPPCFHVYTLAARLHRSIPLARLQRASRDPELHSSTSTRPQRASRAPYGQSARPQLVSRAPELHTSNSAHLHHYSTPLDHSMPPPRPPSSTTPPHHPSPTPTPLQRASRAPFIHTHTPAARPPSSRAPYLLKATRLQRASRALYLYNFPPLRLQSALR